MSIAPSVQTPKTDRVTRLVEDLFATDPAVESTRAVLVTQAYKENEDKSPIMRRALAFKAVCEGLPVVIRRDELVVGANARSPHSAPTFPEYSVEWLEAELGSTETREADPFVISAADQAALHQVHPYWYGRTNSDLASAYMSPEAHRAIDHNVFTPGNYFYNGVGHYTIDYGDIITNGMGSKLAQIEDAIAELDHSSADYNKRGDFLAALRISAQAAITFSERYAAEASRLAANEVDPDRRFELETVAANCAGFAKPAGSFWHACQTFWFLQLLLQTESSGHSISPGRFDVYMDPFYEKDLAVGVIDLRHAQELVDCVWVKFNDLNKIRDVESAKGFAGYSLFQNLTVGGVDKDGKDVSNPVTSMAIEASKHVYLPAPSLSVRVSEETPDEVLIEAAELTRMGTGLPAYYNDKAYIPSLEMHGLTHDDAMEYNIIGCVEPQRAAKTDGWHDAAFFNMCRPLEFVFSQGLDHGEQVGLETASIEELTSFDDFMAVYREQLEYQIDLMVNAINAIDVAHGERTPLPFESMFIEDCIGRGKSVEEGGALYNFTGPQGFGIANVTDSLTAIRTLVFEQKKLTLTQYREALESDFGAHALPDGSTADFPAELPQWIEDLDKYGNDIPEVDEFARDVTNLYVSYVGTFTNPRGGAYQAGLYPVSANVPLGAATGATPDGRREGEPIADGVGPQHGRDVNGPTAAANSVATLDHIAAGNGTLLNQKFHPSAMAGESGLQKFVYYLRGYFDQDPMHVQFNVVRRETLLDAQKHPEKYRSLLVRVAGYSARFTTLSKSLQDDIIARTEQTFA